MKRNMSFWGLSASIKKQMQDEMSKLKSDIQPLEAWVKQTKKEHEEAGTDVNRDKNYVNHATRLVVLKTKYEIKQKLLNQIVQLRIEQYNIWNENKALANSEAFAESGICTA